MKQLWIVPSLLALAATLAAAAPPAMPAFTADVVTTVEGDRNEGRIYSSGTKIRNETTIGGRQTTSIMDLEKKQMWMLLPPPIGCMQTSLAAGPTHPLALPGVDTKEELVGSETFDGHPTKKYRIRTTVDGKSYEMFQWRATDLKGVVVRMTDPAGSYETVYRNVVLGAPDAKLFEPPANCVAAPTAGGLGAPPKK
ncbi:MAG: hypothetical protein ACREQY_23060 [Candidatus Binatia bacterium]